MMTPKRLVVIGASAGGIEAVRELVAGIPASLPAAICVAIHTSSASPGILSDILSRAGSLPVSYARNRERLRAGRVNVAPPDLHLVVEPGLLRVTRGPREHGFRPALDRCFAPPRRSTGRRRSGCPHREPRRRRRGFVDHQAARWRRRRAGSRRCAVSVDAVGRRLTRSTVAPVPGEPAGWPDCCSLSLQVERRMAWAFWGGFSSVSSLASSLSC